MTNLKRIRWSNGQVDAAPTWDALLHRVRTTQWSVMDDEEFRGVMAKRAWRWSGTSIATDGTAEQFIAEWARALLVEILDDADDGKEK